MKDFWKKMQGFKKKEEPQEVKNRMHEAPKEPDFYTHNTDETLTQLQAAYLKKAQGRESAYDPNKFKPVVNEKHVATKATIVDPSSGFAVIDSLDADEKMDALKVLDKKAQVMILRKNAATKQDQPDPNEVSGYHRQSTLQKQDESGSFKADFTTEEDLRNQDHFDLINAQRDYMDRVHGRGDDDETMRLDPYRRRTGAFSEYIPFNYNADPTVKNPASMFQSMAGQIKPSTEMEFGGDDDDTLGLIDDEEEATKALEQNLKSQFQQEKNAMSLAKIRKNNDNQIIEDKELLVKPRVAYSEVNVRFTLEEQKFQERLKKDQMMQKIVNNEDVSMQRRESYVDMKRQEKAKIPKIIEQPQQFDNLAEFRERAQTFVKENNPLAMRRTRISESQEMTEERKKQDQKIQKITNYYKEDLLPLLKGEQKIDQIEEEHSIEDFFEELINHNSKPMDFQTDFYQNMNDSIEDDVQSLSDSDEDKEVQEERKKMDGKQKAVQMSMLQIQKIQSKDKQALKRHQTLGRRLTSKAFGQMDTIDMIKFIDWNERRHNHDAQLYVKENAKWAREYMQKVQESKNIKKQNRISDEVRLKSISQVLAQMKIRTIGPSREEHQIQIGVPTAIAQNDDLIFIGTRLGQVVMYGKEQQDFFGVFQDKQKEYQNNQVTAIEVHPNRPDSIIVGYMQGQLVLFDALKHDKGKITQLLVHKPSTVVNIQFLDWDSKKNDRREKRLQEMRLQSKQRVIKRPDYEATKVTDSWMIASVDKAGQVIISTITKKSIAFGYGSIATTKQTLQVNQRMDESKFYSMSARFASQMNPQPNLNDFETLLAVGSDKRVLIFSVETNKSTIIKEIMCPTYYPDIFGNPSELMQGSLPSMAWGFSHTPILKDQLWATLVIGWGPLIQTSALLDITNQNQFYDDGYVILKQEQSESYARNTSITINQMKAQLNPYEQSKTYSTILNAREKKEFTQSSFESPELFIEKVFFISDSVIMVMTRRLELKLFYTQKMKFGPYNAEFSKELLEAPKQEIDDKIEQFQESASFFNTQAVPRASFRASPEEVKVEKIPSQIDGHICISSMNEQPFGQTFNQMLKLWQGNLLALDQRNIYQFSHLGWYEGLENFKKELEDQKDSWLLLFARAIDIYIGKVKGFKGVPEDINIRQDYMRGELKIMIKNIIQEQLHKWAVERIKKSGGSVSESSSTRTASVVDEDDEFNPYEDNPYAPAQKEKVEKKPVQNQDEQGEIQKQLSKLENEKLDKELIENYKLLTRSIIEFCVAIQDYNFLFEDVFVPFQEQKIEKIFLDELKPFIIAGRISQWELTNDLLQNHIVNYYKDQQHPEILERILVNLNLIDCPNQMIDQLIQFCDKNNLSTGLIYLHMTSIDKREQSTCTVMFMQLLELYKQSEKVSLKAIDQIKDKDGDDLERLEAEKSQFYLGYKIMWTIRLFLNGRRYPNGIMPENKWKSFVYELIKFICNENIMSQLLFIDSAAFFQIVSVLFYPSKVYDFIEESSDLSHESILTCFDKVCKETIQKKDDISQESKNQIKMQYLFFVANVCAKNKVKKDADYYYQVLVELLTKSTQFIQFNEMCMKRSVMGRRSKEMSIKGEAPAEQALIGVMSLCDPLSDERIDQLLQLTESQPEFSHLRVQLLNQKEDFVMCLTLYVEAGKNQSKSQQAVQRVYTFITEKLEMFEQAKQGEISLKSNDMKQIKKQEEEFRKMIFDYFGALVQIDANKAYLMIDKWFAGEQNKFIESLKNNQRSQFIYLDNMFKEYGDQITSLIQKNLMSVLDSLIDKQKADEYMDLQRIHFQLLCQEDREALLERVKQIKKGTIKVKAPEEYLSICESENQVEACAMLAHHMRSYYISVTYYMKILTDEFDYVKLMKQLDQLKYESDDEYRDLIEYKGYMDKNDKQFIKRKLINQTNNIFTANTEAKRLLGEENFISEADMNMSSLYRFDHIIRKVIKITEKLSVETAQNAKQGQDFKEIEDICFCAIEVLIRIKNEHSQALIGLKQTYSKNKQIDTLVQRFNDFMNGRLHFVIEKALNDIEMKKFLDHLVDQDDQIKFTELEEMIKNLYSEIATEQNILRYASKSGYSQIDYLQHSMMKFRDQGIAIKNYQCMKCRLYIDQQFRDAKNRDDLIQNIASKARRGTMINQQRMVNKYAFQSQGDSSDEDNDPFELQDFHGNSIKDIMLYECGHAFHKHCIESYVNERLKEQKQNNQSVKQPQSDKVNLLDDQRCPWCFSMKKTIDFDQIRQQKNSRKKQQKRSVTKQSEDEQKDFSEKIPEVRDRRKNMFSGSIVRQAKLDAREQKLAAFDLTVLEQNLTSMDFY